MSGHKGPDFGDISEDQTPEQIAEQVEQADPYPEHTRLKAIAEQSQAIGEFIEFGGYTLCTFREEGNNGQPQYVWTKRALKANPKREDFEPRLHDFIDGRATHNPDYESWGEGYVPVMKPIQKILAEHFSIDQDQIEAEKRAMLDELRKMNEKRTN
jgi:hypothetical protein